jgi:Ca2+-binding EF-hand superfamily protein
MAVSNINGQYVDWGQDILKALKDARTDTSEDTAKDVVASMDKDGNGSLGMQESGLRAAVFAAVDADGDGVLSMAELAESLAAERAQIRAGTLKDDGSTLTGSLLDQAEAAIRMTDAADQFMTLLDRDGDNALSLKESGLGKEAFAKVDADEDGSISKKELANALLEEQRQYAAGTASNAGNTDLFDALLSKATMAAYGGNPRQIRKALQAYGANVMVSVLSGDDDGSLFPATGYMAGSQSAQLSSILGATTDSSATDISMAGLLDSDI